MSFDLTLRGTHGRQTKCKCPKCDKIHKTKLDWQGRGIPRVYCPVCANVTSHRSGGMDEGVEFHRRAFMTISTQS